MKKMLLLLLLFSLPAVLQAQDATAFIERAVAKLKADAAVHMDYSYAVYDVDGVLLREDSGVMRIDGSRYSLLMDDMKVWCDGRTQWSYMKEVNEIYVTDASSGEAQSLSPLSIMERCRSGFSATMSASGGKVVVAMQSPGDDTGISRVELSFDGASCRLLSMKVFMTNNGRVEAVMTNYAAKCSFPKSSYTCPVADFPTAEVVDMR